MEITIRNKKNGYVLVLEGASKNNGEYVYKATEEFKMLEDIGLNLLGAKVKVEFN